MQFEKLLIEKCAPTLGRLKTGNLFSIKVSCQNELATHVSMWNSRLNEKGVYIAILKTHKNTALVYVYRPEKLLADLNGHEAKKVMEKYGYILGNCENILERLKNRLRTNDEFPHEIGLFLGYPVEDVLGFICHKGQNCKLCGYWKVYGDTEEAIKSFAKFDKCRNIYQKFAEKGIDILQLTVA